MNNHDMEMSEISAASGDDMPESEASQPPKFTKKHKSSTRASAMPASQRLVIDVPTVDNASEYEEVIDDNTVESVLARVRLAERDDLVQVVYEDGRWEDVTLHQLQKLPNGIKAFNTFMGIEVESSSEDSEPMAGHRTTRSMSSTLGKRGRPARKGPSESDDELSIAQPAPKKRMILFNRLTSNSTSRSASTGARRSGRNVPAVSDDEDDSEDQHLAKPTRMSTRGKSKPNYNEKALAAHRMEIDEDSSDEEFVQVVSDIKAVKGKGKKLEQRGRPRKNDGPSKPKAGRPRRIYETSSEDERPEPSRRSGRANKAVKSMREVNEDEEVFADESGPSHGPKILNIREVFQPLSPKSPFGALHNKTCDVCKISGTSKGQGQLIYCQGCSTSIHKGCLGYRSGREHVVTKIGDNEFVFQCRRCIGQAKKKDPTAARLDLCQECKIPGAACAPFSQKKTAKQEEKLRVDNGGVDPITELPDGLINNPDNVLFRCVECSRGFHFEHLPAFREYVGGKVPDDEEIRDERIAEYLPEFRCKDCWDLPGDVQGLIAWRPANLETYNPQSTLNDLSAEEKEFLIKWKEQSYFQCTWMSGAWVWGSVAPATRLAFARRDDNHYPKMTAEDAVPEEYLRMEIIMDVKYTSKVNTHTENIDRDRVTEVDQVLVKFQGLGYDEVVWEHPPDRSEEERWADYVAAYNEYLAGKYFKQPQSGMQKRITDYRKLDFKKHVLCAEQPAALTGGKLMNYQMEGLNWLLYNYHKKKSVILADEMGLGKTLQIISMIAALVFDKPKTWPFLVVVPNSTCPNWRREIKFWAPSLRVVAYYGAKEARDLAMKYELFPDNTKDMRAHIVVTSYETPVDVSSKQFFKKIKWSGIVVDEGQRLKNDKNLLYSALQELSTPFKVLMTGTPLQNNKRELFNLLQFVDDSINAEELDQEYAELTNENIPVLHEKIKPYFLRRTKATALAFLPKLGQVIVPCTMSYVQKKLYKSILSRNADLMAAIFSNTKTTLKPAEKGNLNNILMQLRKVLCHPFMFSQAVEERKLPQDALHRNLVQASPKLQLLDIMLPKLQERGHRVLMFSQFLDQLDIIEDFLIGLGMQYQRLDGNIGSLEKQKRIDAFNAPDSPYFAFLLSTRAGGVGINLATADTVIIMDPDFNPHQDIQALSRAHRIGQKKKVLVFQLMTKDSAEEKVVQIGRSKMALDHVLIESLDQEEDAGQDLESILKHGAMALFEDNNDNAIHYNSASVDKLLDRTTIEDTNAGKDKSAESAFSFARVWANDTGTLTDDIDNKDEPVSDVAWIKIIEQREAEKAREDEKKKEALGKGKRARKAVNYKGNGIPDGPSDLDEDTPTKTGKLDHSDTDFAEDPADVEVDDEDEVLAEDVDVRELEVHKTAIRGIADHSNKQVGEFRRVNLAQLVPDLPGSTAHSPSAYEVIGEGHRHDHQAIRGGHRPDQPPIETTHVPQEVQSEGINPQQLNHSILPGQTIYHKSQKPKKITKKCLACSQIHPVGYCTLKRTGHENCGLCGLAHFGSSRACPHLQSETQVRAMLRALKTSTEPKEDRRAARKYLQGVIGNLVLKKKKDAQRTADLMNGNQGLENRPPLIDQTNSRTFEHRPLPAFQSRAMEPIPNGDSAPLNPTKA